MVSLGSHRKADWQVARNQEGGVLRGEEEGLVSFVSCHIVSSSSIVCSSRRPVGASRLVPPAQTSHRPWPTLLRPGTYQKNRTRTDNKRPTMRNEEKRSGRERDLMSFRCSVESR